ncbi:hypothetical protein [Chitinophaga sp.]|uniref:hypothetical protein n=1 Tax=Chitinophaga sp. TaxID=1869181 RepID=UPI002B5452A0|nr:hypothetical protein [Chitinophaga sp.]HWV69518.1 hypothetical protein [Chitinophaga sp.]
MKNAYPEKPVLKYMPTRVEMATVIAGIKKADYPAEVKRAAYIIFRIESANGTKGINNNYSGFQADAGRWPSMYDKAISGVVQKKENGTGNMRLFIAFNKPEDSLNMLMGRLQARGLYIGGTTHKILEMEVHTVTDLARAYKKEWAAGNPKAEPPALEVQTFKSIYKQAQTIFP